VAAILGDPVIDPHGHPIPPKYEAGVYRDEAPLLEWPVQKPATISSVSDRSAAALRELGRLGLLPGAVLTIEQKNPAASITVRLSGQSENVRVSNDLARCILIDASR
jgi:DtxR family Mn-dependent transcriptional regulator